MAVLGTSVTFKFLLDFHSLIIETTTDKQIHAVETLQSVSTKDGNSLLLQQP